MCAVALAQVVLETHWDRSEKNAVRLNHMHVDVVSSDQQNRGHFWCNFCRNYGMFFTWGSRMTHTAGAEICLRHGGHLCSDSHGSPDFVGP